MDLSKRSVFWLRVAAAAVTLGALTLLYYRIRPGNLIAALRETNPGWFAAAALVYGALFVPAALRWHLALRLSRSSVNRATSLRFSLIGHFFYTILLGAAGGDAAKSAVYARSNGLSASGILAASSLDRLLGFAGLLLFATLTFSVAAAHGAFRQLGQVTMRWPGAWILIASILVIAAILILRKSKFNAAWKHFAETFTQSARRLLSSPRDLSFGIACGFLVQLALSGTLALNLQAVSHDPLPWGRLIWAFPVISVVSALPISVGGLGVRDSAAFVLLGLCGVPGADALAAALLTAAVSLLWAAAGAILLWREKRVRRKDVSGKTVSTVAA